MFVVEEGGPYKANENEQGQGDGGDGGKGQAYLYIRSERKKKLPDFSNNEQEFFLISCLTVATSFVVLSLVQDITVFFIK